MFEHIFRIVIAKISILTLNRINATEPFEQRLSNFQVDSEYADIIKEVMVYTYDSVTKDNQGK
jgi:hypothetical protein